MDKEIKVALGSGWRNYGNKWMHVDLGDYNNLDEVADIRDLGFLEDNSVDVLYSSHSLEYFDQIEVVDVLREWRRVLKKGGKLYISVPDFQLLCMRYMGSHKIYGVKQIRDIIGPILGRMEMDGKMIYHKNLFDRETLSNLLYNCGFKRIKEYYPEDLIGKVDDHSKARMDGDLISLNIVCEK